MRFPTLLRCFLACQYEPQAYLVRNRRACANVSGKGCSLFNVLEGLRGGGLLLLLGRLRCCRDLHLLSRKGATVVN
jgi:hypothetical protein